MAPRTENPRRLRVSATVLALLLALPLAASCDDAISVHDAWARATPPGASTGAAYLTLVNAGEARRLVGAATTAAERAELHTHRQENGMMRMERVEAIELPAGGGATLKPHGDHLMLIGLAAPLVAGDSLRVELVFDNGQRLPVSVPIRDARRP